MFLCYDQEEFFECRHDNKAAQFNFANMVEQNKRRLTIEEKKREFDMVENLDESVFSFADETRINQSRMDDKVAEYEETLTPDALIQ